MAEVKWNIRAQEFANCNCSYGCPCQFSGLPTHGDCRAVIAFQIRTGQHGNTKLDGLKVALIYAWPRAIHEGHGEAAIVIDSRATPAQRESLLRIILGQDTEPGATMFNVFASTLEKVHEPIFADIDFDIDIEKRRGHVRVPQHIDTRIEPILNPVTKAESRVRVDMPNGFEFKLAEIARGWSRTDAPMQMQLADSYSHLCQLNLSESGVIN